MMRKKKSIIGFYTVTIYEVSPDNAVDECLARYPHPLPAAKLVQLAVDKKYQGKGMGSLLVVDAMKRAMIIREAAGIVGLFVDAKDSASAGYYAKFGFTPNPDKPLLLFMPLATISNVLT